MAILEAQLAQAKLIAEEADKKYEEVNTMVVASLEHRLHVQALPPREQNGPKTASEALTQGYRRLWVRQCSREGSKRGAFSTALLSSVLWWRLPAPCTPASGHSSLRTSNPGHGCLPPLSKLTLRTFLKFSGFPAPSRKAPCIEI